MDHSGQGYRRNLRTITQYKVCVCVCMCMNELQVHSGTPLHGWYRYWLNWLFLVWLMNVQLSLKIKRLFFEDLLIFCSNEDKKIYWQSVTPQISPRFWFKLTLSANFPFSSFPKEDLVQLQNLTLRSGRSHTVGFDMGGGLLHILYVWDKH